MLATIATALAMPGAASGAVGGLDATFNPAGTPAGTRTELLSAHAMTSAMTVDASNRTIVVGSVSEGGNLKAFVARYLPGGQLDGSFDGPTGTGDGKFTLDVATGDDRATTVAIDGTGRILVGGHNSDASTAPYVLALQDADGDYDLSFGTNGKATFDAMAGDDTVADIAVDTSDRVVVVGTASGGANSDVYVTRLTTLGGIDSSFATPGNVRFINALAYDQATAVRILPDGRIVVVGQADQFGDPQILTALLDGSGAMDGAWGLGSGFVLRNPTLGVDIARAVTFLPGAPASVIVAGDAGPDSVTFAIQLANGSPHAGWNGSGMRIDPLSPTLGNDSPVEVLVDSQQRVTMMGTAATAGGESFYVARYTSLGSRDNFWGGSGVSYASFAGGVKARGAAFAYGTSRVVVAGDTTTTVPLQVAVARFIGGDPTMTLDVSGCTGAENALTVMPGGFALSNADCVVELTTDSPGGMDLQLRQSDGAGTAVLPNGVIGDYNSGWGAGDSFGMCVKQLAPGMVAQGGLVPNAGCTQVGSSWRGIPISNTTLLTSTGPLNNALARFRFGVQETGANLAAGAYSAEIVLTATANP